MPPIFTPTYWFDTTPEPLAPIALPVIGGLLALTLLAGIAAKVLSKKKSDSLYWSKGGEKMASLCFTMAPIGALLLWFAYEQVQFFGMRAWFVVWVLAAGWWKLRILMYLWRTAPAQAADYAERARIQKWIPHKK